MTYNYHVSHLTIVIHYSINNLPCLDFGLSYLDLIPLSLKGSPMSWYSDFIIVLFLSLLLLHFFGFYLPWTLSSYLAWFTIMIITQFHFSSSLLSIMLGIFIVHHRCPSTESTKCIVVHTVLSYGRYSLHIEPSTLLGKQYLGLWHIYPCLQSARWTNLISPYHVSSPWLF